MLLLLALQEGRDSPALPPLLKPLLPGVGTLRVGRGQPGAEGPAVKPGWNPAAPETAVSLVGAWTELALPSPTRSRQPLASLSAWILELIWWLSSAARGLSPRRGLEGLWGKGPQPREQDFGSSRHTGGESECPPFWMSAGAQLAAQGYSHSSQCQHCHPVPAE